MDKGLGVGAEAGFFHSGPSYNYSYTEGFIVSGDFSYHFRRRALRRQVDPLVLIGPTGYFPTSHGRGAVVGNFGGGVNVWLAPRAQPCGLKSGTTSILVTMAGPALIAPRSALASRSGRAGLIAG